MIHSTLPWAQGCQTPLLPASTALADGIGNFSELSFLIYKMNILTLLLCGILKEIIHGVLGNQQ